MSKAEEAVGATGGACPRESFWQREQQGQRPKGKKKIAWLEEVKAVWCTWNRVREGKVSYRRR